MDLRANSIDQLLNRSIRQRDDLGMSIADFLIELQKRQRGKFCVAFAFDGIDEDWRNGATSLEVRGRDSKVVMPSGIVPEISAEIVLACVCQQAFVGNGDIADGSAPPPKRRHLR